LPEQGASLAEVERKLIEQALEKTGGNQVRAAKLLDITRDALRHRMKKYGLL
jgi:two-component system NtrC family response regulator